MMTETSMGPPEISPMSLSSYPPILEDDDLLPSWSRDPSPPDGVRNRTSSETRPASMMNTSESFQDPLAPLSFSNVASLPSLSPKPVPVTPLDSPSLLSGAAGPGALGLTSAQPQIINEDFASNLTEGLERRDTTNGAAAIDNDGRIQASFSSIRMVCR